MVPDGLVQTIPATPEKEVTGERKERILEIWRSRDNRETDPATFPGTIEQGNKNSD